MTREDEFRTAVTPHLEVMAMLAARLAPSAAPGTVVRDAGVLAWRHRSSFDPARASLRSWLLAITAECAHTARPRRGRAATPAVRDGGPSKRPALDVALGSLPDRQRFAVDCIHFVGLSVSETAELMRLPERSVRSAEAAAQRRIRTLVGSGDGPSDGRPADLLQAAGATWRARFCGPLPDPVTCEARQDIPPRAGAEAHPAGTAGEDAEPVAVDPGSAESEVEPEPGLGSELEAEPEGRRRRKWLLPTLIGIVVLIGGGTIVVVRAVGAAKIAAAQQADRDFQLCGQVPPGLTGAMVTRSAQGRGGDFVVRVVAKRPMSVYAAQVTGVDEEGKIATYVKHDVVTRSQLVISVVTGPGESRGTRTSVAQDRCDGKPAGAQPSTTHLVVFAFAGQGSLVMDAGPVDRLAVVDG